MWPADQRKSLSTSTWLWGACIWTRGFGSGSEELEGAQPRNVLVISPSSRTGTAVLCSHRALQAKAATQQRDGGQAPNVESRGRMGGGRRHEKIKHQKTKNVPLQTMFQLAPVTRNCVTCTEHMGSARSCDRGTQGESQDNKQRGKQRGPRPPRGHELPCCSLLAPREARRVSLHA